MGMATSPDPLDGMSKWQRRMKRVGYAMFEGKRPEDMSDEECRTAFKQLSARFGIAYIWND